ncbi:MAG: serine/threonine protein phosphatase [Clostridiales bacterium]|jgi:UDP-2,3-diacylglucosamine pyrophosphatase LpxH|nr:serine/threonine protein phosphatase [Clostridiales bacterium]
MQINKRLHSVYKNARTEYFDENSKYIFFSDLHRGDDSASDEFTRNQNVLLHALNYYFANGYVYVEAGDGDDLWEYSDFKNIRLAHSDVFLAIKKFFDEGRLVMLYGNHNIYLRSGSFVRDNYYTYYDEFSQNTKDLLNGLVPVESLVLKNRKSGAEIFVLHGHQGDLMNDRLWRVSMLVTKVWRNLRVVGFKNPTSPAKNLYKRSKIEVRYKEWIEKHKKFIICGHTHRPKFSETHELPYFNTGCCTHTKGITGIEICNGSIMLVNWRVKAEPNGNLIVERCATRGPCPIEGYDFRGLKSRASRL